MFDKIKKLAEYLGIDEDELKVTLGLPTRLDMAKTFKEAKSIRSSARRGSELYKAAWIKMIKLATTFKEAKSTFSSSSHQGFELRRSVAIRMYELATTYSEVESSYYYLLYAHVSEYTDAALAKMAALTIKSSAESSMATNTELIHDVTLHGDDSLCVSKTKIIESATTFDEIRLVLDEKINSSDFNKVTLANLTALGTQALERANTVNEAKSVYSLAPHNSQLENAALKRIFELVTSFNEIKLLYNGGGSMYNLSCDRDKLKKAAFCKMLDLSVTLDMAKFVYKSTVSSTQRRMAVEKMLTFI